MLGFGEFDLPFLEQVFKNMNIYKVPQGRINKFSLWNNHTGPTFKALVPL